MNHATFTSSSTLPAPDVRSDGGWIRESGDYRLWVAQFAGDPAAYRLPHIDLGVLPWEVVDVGDGWVAADCGVVSVMVVGVEPSREALSASGGSYLVDAGT